MKTIGIIILAIVLSMTNTWAGAVANVVQVRIVTDDGRRLPTYPVKMHHGACKVYTEAIKGDHIKQPVYDLTIQVIDMEVAIQEIEVRLSQVKAKITAKKRDEGGGFLQAEIAVPNVATLLDLFRAVGKVTLEASPLVMPDGNVTVNIKIVHHP